MYAPAPPDGVTEAVPLDPPLQDTFVCAPVAVLIAVGCVMVKFLVVWHVFASVMVTVYAHGASPDAVAAVHPDGDQE